MTRKKSNTHKTIFFTNITTFWSITFASRPSHSYFKFKQKWRHRRFMCRKYLSIHSDKYKQMTSFFFIFLFIIRLNAIWFQQMKWKLSLNYFIKCHEICLVPLFIVLKANKQDFVAVSHIQKSSTDDYVVRLEGLPWNSKENEIQQFFHGMAFFIASLWKIYSRDFHVLIEKVQILFTIHFGWSIFSFENRCHSIDFG